MGSAAQSAETGVPGLTGRPGPAVHPLTPERWPDLEGGRIPGVLAYLDGRPVGWCSVAPREEYPALDRSPVLRRVDGEPVWSIVCFYIDRRVRRRGVMGALLRGAVEHAGRNGARVVEAYPVDPVRGPVGTGSAFAGFAAAFREAGFTEVARRSATRPIMRLAVGGVSRGTDRPTAPGGPRGPGA
jgi:GNAT superfamily N-acetyltransferase